MAEVKVEGQHVTKVVESDHAIRRQIPRLYDVSNTIRDLVDALINEETGEVDTDSLQKILNETEKFEETALNIGLLVKELLSEANRVKEAVAELSTRQRFFTNRAERLKSSLQQAMESAGYSSTHADKSRRKIVGTLVTLTLAKGVESVNIVDEEKIPEDYVRIKTEIDKAAIKKDLNEGVEIPGAELKRGFQSLRIKMDTT